MNLSVKNHALYLCYFGIREPLVQTQVLPYLREITKDHIKISLLTFEPNFSERWTPAQIKEQKAALATEQIEWYCLPYHKRPTVPATLYDVYKGALFARRMIRENNVCVLHARSHVAAMMGALAKSQTGGKVKLLFDIRGFFPEEYTDGGNWKPNGKLYHAVKRAERWLFAQSDAFVILTERARDILFSESRESDVDRLGRPIRVIPCCVDLPRFQEIKETTRAEMRRQLNVENRFVIVYSGSFGTWYMASEMVDFFAAAREKDSATFALILTQSPREAVIGKLKEKGFSENDFLVRRVAPFEIPEYLSAADIAISFIRASYSKQASSPTKIAEYLASGLPIVCNAGVGDVDEVIKADQVGAILADFNSESYLKALQEIRVLQNDGDVAQRCRRSADERFDLVKVGGAKYRSLYRQLLAPPPMAAEQRAFSAKI